MITLYQPPPAWGLPSISPYCSKLETYLRMTKLDYKIAKMNILKAPNGRVPYIDLDGQIFGDTTLIIRELKKRFGDSFDANLSKEQQAQALLLQRLVEDHLYYAVAWLRYDDENSWTYVRDYFKGWLPPLMGGMITKKIRKEMLKTLIIHGIGEHNKEEIINFAKADLTAISDTLGDKPFFLGEDPSTIDATMYGFLIHLLFVPWESPTKEHALKHKNLPQYCERMKKKFWS